MWILLTSFLDTNLGLICGSVFECFVVKLWVADMIQIHCNFIDLEIFRISDVNYWFLTLDW